MKCPNCENSDILVAQTQATCRECGHTFGGVWVAHYHDKSGAVPFGSEVEALRHAVENSMAARFVPFGETI